MKCTRKASRIESFVKGFTEQPWWVGLDVHKRSYSVALRRVDGQSLTWTSPPDPQALLTTFERHGLRPRLIVQEAGPTGYQLARVLIEAGLAVCIAAPSKIPRPVTAGAKSDRLDSQRLAEYAARDMITGIAIPTKEEELFRALVRRRQKLTNCMRACKQRIRAMLLFHDDGHGIDFPTWNAAHIEMLRSIDLPAELRLLLESHFTELEGYENNRAMVDQQIECILSTHPVWAERVRLLKSVPGIGPRAATTFVAEIFRPGRFNSGGEVSSYLGLAPIVHHSGIKTPRGRIRSMGQQTLRTLLIEAAWIVTRHDPGMTALYHRLLARGGQTQKAIVAVARRLGIICWRIVVERRPYYPLQIAE